MAIRGFEGKTFVSFIDISGFKRMMEDEERALDALDLFYNAGFNVLENQTNTYPIIKGILVSDCGILFARSKPDKMDNIKILNKMLKVISDINKRLINNQIMLTASIAYGSFKYQKRIVLQKLNKEYIYGRPYIKAYLDNDGSNPKIRPGECRILAENLPSDVKLNIEVSINDHIGLFDKNLQDIEHYYYYWMCKDTNLIGNYKIEYDNIYSNGNFHSDDEKYRQISLLIKSYSTNSDSF